MSQIKPHSELPAINLIELGVLCKVTPPGNFVEVGVYKGGSAFVLYQEALKRGCQLHLFDTFTGIPLKGELDRLPIGAFKDTDAATVKGWMPEAFLHVGYFPQTLTKEVTNIAFVHIDCDQYETCKAAIELLYPRMVSGGIMAFDDYPSFPGIKKAVDDAFPNLVQLTECKIPYITKWSK